MGEVRMNRIGVGCGAKPVHNHIAVQGVGVVQADVADVGDAGDQNRSSVGCFKVISNLHISCLCCYSVHVQVVAGGQANGF